MVKQLSKELDVLYKKLKDASKRIMGYPATHGFDYSTLFRFLKFPANNIGDAFLKPSFWRINTLSVEKKLVDRLAKIFHAPKNNYWGYVTNGGTEGNLHGLYIARELFPNSPVFFSDQAHYSVLKNLRILRMPYVVVQSHKSGEMDYDFLRKVLNENIGKGPPILFVNIGTTMKGAIDDLDQIHQILSELKIEKYYIHCDAAFYGMILPFVPHFNKSFDFRAGIDSIVVSGHKMIGSPIPCGVLITKKSHVLNIQNAVEYVGIHDRTISGSRNAVTPLFLWHELSCLGERKFKKRVIHCYKMADYAVNRFNALGVPAWKNPYGLTIVLPRPSDALAREWQFPVQGQMSCMLALPQLTYKIIDRFICAFLDDIKKNK